VDADSSYFIAEAVSATDYSPFGAPLPGRSKTFTESASSSVISTESFTSGTNGWTSSGTHSVLTGNYYGQLAATITGRGSDPEGMQKTFATEEGKQYKVVFTVNTIGWPSFRVQDSISGDDIVSTGMQLPGTYSYTFVARGSRTTLYFEEVEAVNSTLVLSSLIFFEEDKSPGYRYGFNGYERDDEVKGSENSTDFGDRMYDNRLGRMFKPDPFEFAYPGTTPYGGMGSNPIVNTDVGGKLVILINGFGFGRSTMPATKRYTCWDAQMRQNIAATLKDNKAIYFNGSSKGLLGPPSLIEEKMGGDDFFTTPESRFDAGAEAVKGEMAMIIKQQLDDQRKTNPNAKINVVAHSMGVAYSAGVVQGLLDAKDAQGNTLFTPDDFGEIWLLAAYQADRIKYPMVGNIHQRAHTNDFVAGSNRIPGVKDFEKKAWPTNRIDAHASATFNEYFVTENQLIGDLVDVLGDLISAIGRIFRGDGGSSGGGPTRGGNNSCSVRTLNCCFTKGTRIMIHNGSQKNIEQIEIGDTIKTMNLQKMQPENKVVTRISSPEQYALVSVSLSDGTILVNTYDHSYYIKGKGWSSYNPTLTRKRYHIDAKQLEEGDIVYKLHSDGKYKAIKVNCIERLKEEKQMTYTLFTEGENHNYFANGVLVHDDGIQNNTPMTKK
jgi:RHS repeat-associated protein